MSATTPQRWIVTPAFLATMLERVSAHLEETAPEVVIGVAIEVGVGGEDGPALVAALGEVRQWVSERLG